MEGILKNQSLAEERNKRDMIVSFLFHRDRNMLGKTRLPDEANPNRQKCKYLQKSRIENVVQKRKISESAD